MGKGQSIYCGGRETGYLCRTMTVACHLTLYTKIKPRINQRLKYDLQKEYIRKHLYYIDNERQLQLISLMNFHGKIFNIFLAHRIEQQRKITP